MSNDAMLKRAKQLVVDYFNERVEKNRPEGNHCRRCVRRVVLQDASELEGTC